MGRYITTTGTFGTVLKTVGTLHRGCCPRQNFVYTPGGFTITLPSPSLLENDTIQIVDVTGAFGHPTLRLHVTARKSRTYQKI